MRLIWQVILFLFIITAVFVGLQKLDEFIQSRREFSYGEGPNFPDAFRPQPPGSPKKEVEKHIPGDDSKQEEKTQIPK